MQKTTFSVYKRQDKKPGQLRREGVVPANMYQAGSESRSLQVLAKDFVRLERNLSENAIIYLTIEGESAELPVLIDEVQYDSLGKQLLHVVFRKVNLREKIKAEISVETTSEFKVDNGVLVLVKSHVEVEALPTDLPENFVVDLSVFKQLGDQITLADLAFDRDKVTLVLAEDEQPEEVVVALAQEKAEEVEEEASNELVEPELVGGEKKEAEEASSEAAAKE